MHRLEGGKIAAKLAQIIRAFAFRQYNSVRRVRHDRAQIRQRQAGVQRIDPHEPRLNPTGRLQHGGDDPARFGFGQCGNGILEVKDQRIRITHSLLEFVAQTDMPREMIMGIIIPSLLVMGMFMDQLAILSLAMPLAFPTAMALDYNLVWFGLASW